VRIKMLLNLKSLSLSLSYCLKIAFPGMLYRVNLLVTEVFKVFGVFFSASGLLDFEDGGIRILRNTVNCVPVYLYTRMYGAT
jgi:hypothetical protein